MRFLSRNSAALPGAPQVVRAHAQAWERATDTRHAEHFLVDVAHGSVHVQWPECKQVEGNATHSLMGIVRGKFQNNTLKGEPSRLLPLLEVLLSLAVQCSEEMRSFTAQPVCSVCIQLTHMSAAIDSESTHMK